MSEWISNRPPTLVELAENKLTFATVWRFDVNNNRSLAVVLSTGFSIRAFWGRKYSNEFTLAWMEVPQPWGGQEVQETMGKLAPKNNAGELVEEKNDGIDDTQE